MCASPHHGGVGAPRGSTLGAGGYLAARLHLDHGWTALGVAGILAATPILLTTSHSALVVAAQTLLQLMLAVTGIHAGRVLHAEDPTAPPGVRSVPLTRWR